ncbi:hypothetical protein BD410DRAFT_293517 [Rickenella mellea]|uniref:Uncharacterized protein n=1 Tax=Rickenella mellea TaxID=50990 RepID=A0A4Y7Q1H9_9AGAM|nr:hypothetical protein BD410DRAFT_293517 [Rickenella mellea]
MLRTTPDWFFLCHFVTVITSFIIWPVYGDESNGTGLRLQRVICSLSKGIGLTLRRTSPTWANIIWTDMEPMELIIPVEVGLDCT